MAFKIITADERLSDSNTKSTIAIFGLYGVGKTSLLKTLDEKTTLCLDFEAGMKSVQDWKGDSIPLRSYQDAMDIACLIGGPNPSLRPQDPFSEQHYAHVKEQYKGVDLAKYKTVFFDSISDLTHVAMQYAKTQPGAYNKQGVEDIRGAYGELGRQVISMLKHLQHAPGVNMIFVGRLERIVDDFNREVWQPSMTGGMVGRELPGIVDEVISLAKFDYDETTGWKHNPDKGKERAFVCWNTNPFGLPAKTRSADVEMIEEPHLGKLLDKMNRRQTPRPMNFGAPQTAKTA